MGSVEVVDGDFADLRRRFAMGRRRLMQDSACIEKQDCPVKNLGTVGYVLPGSEFLRRMADAVSTGHEDHSYRRNFGDLLRVLPCFAWQIDSSKIKRLRGVTDDGLQGGIGRSRFRIVH